MRGSPRTTLVVATTPLNQKSRCNSANAAAENAGGFNGAADPASSHASASERAKISRALSQVGRVGPFC